MAGGHQEDHRSRSTLITVDGEQYRVNVEYGPDRIRGHGYFLDYQNTHYRNDAGQVRPAPQFESELREIGRRLDAGRALTTREIRDMGLLVDGWHRSTIQPF